MISTHYSRHRLYASMLTLKLCVMTVALPTNASVPDCIAWTYYEVVNLASMKTPHLKEHNTCVSATPCSATRYSFRVTTKISEDIISAKRYLLKKSFRSTLKSVISPSALTKDRTSQLALGPFHRFHVCPATDVPVVIWEPTGWIL